MPADLHLAKLPPVAADGTAECWRCRTRIAFAQLDIAGDAYVCRPCQMRTAQVEAPAVDLDNVKLGSGTRWWLIALAGIALVGSVAVIVLRA